MNVLADFIVRVEEQYPMSIENEELNSLLTTIRNQATEIESLNKEVTSLRLNIEQFNVEHTLRNDSKKRQSQIRNGKSRTRGRCQGYGSKTQGKAHIQASR